MNLIDMPENCARKLNSLLHAHAQSIRRRLNSYNFAAGLSCNLNIIAKLNDASEARSIVSTTAEFSIWTKEHDSKRAG
jgi:hypothetical protein